MLIHDGPVPLYQQIADEIRQRIASEAIPPGHAVPSEQQIIDEYGVSRITASKALHTLRDEDLIYALPGQGFFVCPEDVPRVPRTQPVYRMIAAEIAARIRAGELRPNQRIPGEKTIQQQYGVAKVTARHVFELLREQGWAFTVPYRGSYVRPPEDWPEDEQPSGAAKD